MKLLQPSRPYRKSRAAAFTAMLLSSVTLPHHAALATSSPTSSSPTTVGIGNSSTGGGTHTTTNNAFVPRSSQQYPERNKQASTTSTAPPSRRRLDLDEYEESTTVSRSSLSSCLREGPLTSNRRSRTVSEASLSKEDNRLGVPPVRIGGRIVHEEEDLSSSQQQPPQRWPRDSSTTSSIPSKSGYLSSSSLSNLQGGSMTTTSTTTTPSTRRTTYDLSPSIQKVALKQQYQKRKKHNNRLLQISLSLVLSTSTLRNTSTPIATYLDTGAQVTVMTYAACQKAGMAHLIDTRYAGHACGVGGVSCKVLGRVPAQTVSFWVETMDETTGIVEKKRIDRSPAITILDNKMEDGVEMLLGMDVLEEWQALICLRDRTLTVRQSGLGRKRGSGGVGGSPLQQQQDGESTSDLVIPFVPPQGSDGLARRTRRSKLKDVGGSEPTMRSTSTASSAMLEPQHSQQQQEPNRSAKKNKPKRPIANFHSLDDTATSDYSDLESDLDILDKTSNHIEWEDASNGPSYWDEIKSRNDWRDEESLYDYDIDVNRHGEQEEDDEDDIFSSESDHDDLAGCDLSGI